MASTPAFLRAASPTLGRVLVVLLLYAIYLPLSGYTVGQFRFDAGEYWELSLKFTQAGRFSLLTFDEPLRGYFGPLLVLPGRLLCHFTGCSMLTGARVMGAGWAAVLFGVAIPQLWNRVTGQPISHWRWLLLVGLGFLFWRDYFNFTLSDMPALALLGLGLAASCRSKVGWALVAGFCIAAAINIRPIYLASVPGLLWLLWVPSGSGTHKGWRLAALVAGAALVLLPQSLINQHYFQSATPLVMTGQPNARPLYLRQLTWGTAFQRYETSLIPGIPRSLIYADPSGQQLLQTVPGRTFASYGQFLSTSAQNPVSTIVRFLHHLFNGLDIWFPTPYPTQLHPAGQAALRLLNYGLLGLGIWLAAIAIFQKKGQMSSPNRPPKAFAQATLLAVALPCALALPTLMECRFLLPLHLLLLTGVAATWRPAAWWAGLGSPLRRVVLLALAVGWLWGCWQLSESTARQLRPPSEAPQD